MRPYIYKMFICLLTIGLVFSQSSGQNLTTSVVTTATDQLSSTNSTSFPADTRMNYPKLLEQILKKSKNNKTVLSIKPNKRLELKQEAIVTSTDASNIPEQSSTSVILTTLSTIQTPTSTNNKTEEESGENKFVEFFKGIVSRVDRYTLIMICAFLSFFLLIILTIWIVYCICRGCSKLNRKRRPKRQQELINPAYEFRILNEPPNPNIDFLDDPVAIDGNNNDKKKSPIYKGDTETPKSWSGDEEKALLESKHPTDSEKKDNSHLAKQEETSSTSSDSSLDSIIAKTYKKSLIGTPKNNNKDVNKSSVMITPPPSATTSTPASGGVVTGGGHKFTPSLRDKTKQQISKEVQSSRRSLHHDKITTATTRTNSESSSNFDLPPHYPSKRRSIVSSSSSINGGGVGGSSGKAGSVIDFSLVKNEVDDLFENINTNTSHSSISSINQSHHSINVSVSNIYMDAIREKRERIELEKRSRLNQTKIATPSDVPDLGGVSMNPTGGGANKNTNLTKTYSTVTLESEKSCY